ncbi:FHA domain-containing protein [Curtobacterium sp. MCSS17_007]|uniref:FHA domain-containing protein n=1 Tax=Curtobacterium sp. MCSS17_007 TaxID=2175646 RepID=UPI0011B5A05A|nr:FHA domain-containing protein [Curtobacterium sp. MCSS17_007]WIE74338.1 FHA domain-containing protein [Curtobacterium sp. MCSS17_007]
MDDTPPPPLRQPDQQGRHPDPASEAWLPEATLDPATRAWLTGEDRQRGGSVPAERPSVPRVPRTPTAERAATEPSPDPQQAPARLDRGAPGTRDLVGSDGSEPADRPDVADRTDVTDRADSVERPGSVERQDATPAGEPLPTSDVTVLPEPSLDPDAQPVPAEDRASATAPAALPRAEEPAGQDVDDRGASLDPALPAEPREAPVWAPPAQQVPVAPSRPSWWVGRSASEATTTDGQERQDDLTDQRPQPGDTAVVEPLVDRRPAPTPLVAPGSGPAACPVCGHTLEPDDIFCAECGAVRPTVTAAFTGPVVPLPVARPDWAADGELSSDEQPGDEQPGDEQSGDEQLGDEQPGDEEPGAELRADGARGDVPSNGAPSEQRRGLRSDLPGDEAAPPSDGVGDADVPVAPDTTPRTPVPRTSGLRLPGRRRRAAAAAAAAAAADPAGDAATGAPAAPASPTVPSSAPRHGADAAPQVPTAAPLPPLPTAEPFSPLPTAAPLPPLPTAEPLPPMPGATGPVLPAVGQSTAPTSGEAAPDDDEDVEETRIVEASATNAPFVLHFSTGERSAVRGTGLLGRLPRPQPGERFDDLLTVHDPGKSVSKTHLELGRDADDLWVSDRFSGNGTVIRHIDGSIRRCEPGRRYRVERGARVDIGEQFFLVQ